MVNKYKQMDDEGRAIVISLYGNKLNLVAGEDSDVFDLSGTTLSGDFYLEVKYRKDLSSTHYDSDMIEYKKLAAMRNVDKTADHYYLMLFADGIIRSYNLKDISIFDCHFENRECPVSKAEDRGFTNKLVIDLPIKKAKIKKWK